MLKAMDKRAGAVLLSETQDRSLSQHMTLTDGWSRHTFSLVSSSCNLTLYSTTVNDTPHTIGFLSIVWFLLGTV